MHDFFLEWLIGAIVWTFANVLYVDLRRNGRRRGRLLSFIAGYPGTLVSYFAVKEGRIPRIAPPDDDEDGLLREIQADRQSRVGGATRSDHAAGMEAREGEPGGPPGD